jgi:hypothetical protein
MPFAALRAGTEYFWHGWLQRRRLPCSDDRGQEVPEVLLGMMPAHARRLEMQTLSIYAAIAYPQCVLIVAAFATERVTELNAKV